MRSVCVSWVVFYGLACHPWPCMLLKVHFVVDSIPSALTIFPFTNKQGKKNRRGTAMRLAIVLFTILFSLSVFQLFAEQNTRGADLAPTPPMGWNSWDSYGMTIQEPEYKANADWMAAHLKQYGWTYAVIDEGWFLQNPESDGKPAWKYTLDQQGRFIPAPNRFPSAANGAGFRPLADYVH